MASTFPGATMPTLSILAFISVSSSTPTRALCLVLFTTLFFKTPFSFQLTLSLFLLLLSYFLEPVSFLLLEGFSLFKCLLKLFHISELPTNMLMERDIA